MPLQTASHWKCTLILVELKLGFKSILLRLTRNLTIRKTMELSLLMASNQLMDNLRTLLLVLMPSLMTNSQQEERPMTRILLTNLKTSLKT